MAHANAVTEADAASSVLHAAASAPFDHLPLYEALVVYERRRLASALLAAGGVLEQAARLLGVENGDRRGSGRLRMRIRSKPFRDLATAAERLRSARKSKVDRGDQDTGK